MKEAPDGRKVVVLSISDGESGNLQLFGPRLISTGGQELKLTSYECVEYCWVIQERVCELQQVAPVTDAEIRARYGLLQ